MLKKTTVSILAMGASLLLAVSLMKSISPLGHGAPAPVLLTSAVENLISAIGSLIALWYLFTALAVLVSVAFSLVGSAPLRLDRAIGKHGAPLLRRIAAWTAVSTMVIGGPAMASTAGDPLTDASVAANSTDSRNATSLVDLGWVVTPITTEQKHPADEAQRDPPPQEDPEDGSISPSDSTNEVPNDVLVKYTVRPGDSLWGIAKAHLESESENVTATDIADHWPLWHLENLHKIGSDPDLITPGMTLHAPPPEEI